MSAKSAITSLVLASAVSSALATIASAAPLTKAPEGVSAYEWARDSKSLAFLTRDPMPRWKEQHEAVLRDLRCGGSCDDLHFASAGGAPDGDAVAGI